MVSMRGLGNCQIEKTSLLSIGAVPQTCLRYARGISLKQKRFKLLINAYRRQVCGIQGYKFERKLRQRKEATVLFFQIILWWQYCR